MIVSLLAVYFGWASFTAAPAPAYRLETKEAQRIQAELSWQIQAPNLTAKEWIVIAPAPPELPCQTKTSAALDPAGKAILELSGQERPMLMARVPVRDKKFEQEIAIKVGYQATLLSRKLVRVKADEKPPEVPPLKAAERKAYLAFTAFYDSNSKVIQRWLANSKLARGKDEGDLELGKRVFLDIKKNWKYEFEEGMDRTASVVCAGGKSDCGGLSILFVTAMRANGVPARILAGRWATSAKPGGEVIGGVATFQEHVKAEFYADGIGWVPVDLAKAVCADNSADGLQFFGNDPGDFLVLHTDTELVLDSIHFGKHTLPLLQGVAHFISGKGNDKGLTVKRGWEVKAAK